MAKLMPMTMKNHKMPMRPPGGTRSKSIPMDQVMRTMHDQPRPAKYGSMGSKTKKAYQSED